MPTPPVSSTPHLGLGKWNDGDNAGALALNNNWDLIDEGVLSASQDSNTYSLPLESTGVNVVLNLGNNVRLLGDNLETIQDIRTTDSPTFAGITVNGDANITSMSVFDVDATNIHSDNLSLTDINVTSASIGNLIPDAMEFPEFTLVPDEGIGFYNSAIGTPENYGLVSILTVDPTKSPLHVFQFLNSDTGNPTVHIEGVHSTVSGRGIDEALHLDGGGLSVTGETAGMYVSLNADTSSANLLLDPNEFYVSSSEINLNSENINIKGLNVEIGTQYTNRVIVSGSMVIGDVVDNYHIFTGSVFMNRINSFLPGTASFDHLEVGDAVNLPGATIDTASIGIANIGTASVDTINLTGPIHKTNQPRATIISTSSQQVASTTATQSLTFDVEVYPNDYVNLESSNSYIDIYEDGVYYINAKVNMLTASPNNNATVWWWRNEFGGTPYDIPYSAQKVNIPTSGQSKEIIIEHILELKWGDQLRLKMYGDDTDLYVTPTSGSNYNIPWTPSVTVNIHKL